MRDILTGEDPQILHALSVIDHIAPDILVLTDFDYDGSGAALSAFSRASVDPFPFQFASAPNAGSQTGLDLDANGFAGDARDALGYGRFFGDGGMAILSRYPIDINNIIDLTDIPWADVPNATLPTQNGTLFPSPDVFETLPLSSTAHWIVPIEVGGDQISLLAFDATPPVFDGPEDFNGLRNRDEILIWNNVLAGDFGGQPANPIVIGNANMDPVDGDGLHDGIEALLNHNALQDPTPRSNGALLEADRAHSGAPEHDTADWPADGPGNLRVSYVLPSVNFDVTNAGVFWPAPDDPDAALLGDREVAGAHHLVWVDLVLKRPS